MDKQIKNTIKAILFSSGEPFECEKLSSILKITLDELAVYIDEINEEYKSEPFIILHLDNQLQMCVKKEYSKKVNSALSLKRDLPLSQASMEILAIIAYNEPVTKAFIEQIRGVDSSSTVNTLLKRSLVEEAGRLELPGRPIAYKTTDTFLRCFGLSSLKHLPNIPTENDK